MLILDSTQTSLTTCPQVELIKFYRGLGNAFRFSTKTETKCCNETTKMILKALQTLFKEDKQWYRVSTKYNCTKAQQLALFGHMLTGALRASNGLSGKIGM